MQKPPNPLHNKDGSVTARPCHTAHLTDVYGVTRKTLYTWLRPHRNELGRKTSFYYTQAQVELIFEKLGHPKNWNLKCDTTAMSKSAV